MGLFKFADNFVELYYAEEHERIENKHNLTETELKHIGYITKGYVIGLITVVLSYAVYGIYLLYNFQNGMINHDTLVNNASTGLFIGVMLVVFILIGFVALLLHENTKCRARKCIEVESD